MNILLIYNISSECLQLFYFKEVDEKLASLLLRCHGKYINSIEDKNMDVDVFSFLSNPPVENRIFDDTAAYQLIPTIDVCNIIVAGIIA